jgi:hypothetical protein
MLKGIPLTFVILCAVMSPLYTSENVKETDMLYLKDTVKTVTPVSSAPQINLSQPALQIKEEINSETKRNEQKRIDSILAGSERRDQKISSRKKITALQKQEEFVASPDTNYSLVPPDTSVFLRKRAVADNFLLAISHKTVSQNFDTSLLRKHSSSQLPHTLAKVTSNHADVKEKTGFAGTLRAKSPLNWLPGVLLFSLFVFSWIKTLYQKYMMQIIVSLVNYQVSLRLLREKNVLYRNIAFGLNIVFAINGGLFIFFIIQHFGYVQIYPNYIISILIYSMSLIVIYNIKTFVCTLLGYVFKVQDEFSEYTHNINLFNKNIGLFLFPIIILFPYVNVTISHIVIYVGILVIMLMFVLRTIRGFQIIMRKGISLFYLILYLCAIEILPVLLAVKYSYTMI